MSKRKFFLLDEKCYKKKHNFIIRNDESIAENFLYLKEDT